MDSSVKIKLSLYMILSGTSYIYLNMTSRPSISVLVFIIIQFISIYFIIKNREEVKNKKGIFMMIPIFIIGINYFISSNYMFRSLNYFVIIILYSSMILIMKNEMSINNNNFDFIFNIFVNMFMPFTKFKIPFKWCATSHKNGVIEKYNIKRILLGIGISIPCVIFLLMMLSSADMVFSQRIYSFSTWFRKLFNFLFMYKSICGIVVGLYLFGFLYSIFSEKKSNESKILNNNLNEKSDLIPTKKISGDVLIINILLISILTVYTLFIGIQFKYLFAGAELPNGLNYAEYARRGFFELVFLSVLNVGLILITVFLLKEKIYEEKNMWSKVTQVFLLYLCCVTIILLVSSFYRMMLYDNEYGFTRLRIIVYLFLIFEGAGLLITLKYVLKPKFNIVLVYCIIGLVYYMTLNVIQIDYFIAKRNITMYFESERENIDMDYLMTLSCDAAPQIARLLDCEDVDIMTKYKSEKYFNNIYKRYVVNDVNEKYWQNYNLSIEKAKKLVKSIVID